MDFINKIKEKFFEKEIHEEIPTSKSLAPDVDRIIREVCKLYDINTNGLLISRRGYFNEPRNVAIYLITHIPDSKRKS